MRWLTATQLVNGAGVQFDGDAVRAFIAALRAGTIDMTQVEAAARTAPAQEQHVEPGEVITVDPEFRRAEDVVDPTVRDDPDELPLAA